MLPRRLAPWVMVLAGCATGPRPAPAPAPTPVKTSTVAPVPTATVTAAQPVAPRFEASPEAKAKAIELLEQGRALQKERGEGGAKEAIAIYQSALESDPNLAAAYWEIGWSAQLLTQWDQVIEAWDHVRALDPDHPELGKAYALAVLQRNEARALAGLPDPGLLPPPDEKPAAGPSIRLRAVGDVQMGRAWPAERAELPPDDAADLFMHVTAALSDADLTFGNLETALADDGDSSKCGPKSTKCFAFRVPTSFAIALKKAGFDVMSIANNHSGDFGIEGRASTVAALDKQGIKHAGLVGDIASMTVNGVTVGLVGFSTGGGVYRVVDLDIARRLVALVDQTHDIVIVSFHGGAEGTAAAHVPKKTELFYGENRGNVYEFAHTVIDAGADLVLGHGPHLLRAMEVYKGRLAVYSMGNFSTWETFSLVPPLNTTAIMDVTLAPNGVLLALKAIPVIIEKPGRPRLDPDNLAIPILRTLSQEDMGSPLIDESGQFTRPSKP